LLKLYFAAYCGGNCEPMRKHRAFILTWYMFSPVVQVNASFFSGREIVKGDCLRQQTTISKRVRRTTHRVQSELGVGRRFITIYFDEFIFYEILNGIH
jgi:hypothetical protein